MKKKKTQVLRTMTDIKVFLLYVLDRVSFPMDEITMSYIIVDNAPTFSMQYDEALSMLVESGHIHAEQIDGKTYYIINDLGRMVARELYIAQVQLQDEAKFFINMNLYYIGNAEYYEIRAQKEGDDAIASNERYYYFEKLSDNQYVSTTMERSTYKDEEAFSGQTIGADGSVQLYYSDECPMVSQTGTQLNEMDSMAWYFKTLMNMVTLFERYEPYEVNGETYDIDSFVTRECTLYKNYIVFKQTAPFLCLPLGMDIEIMHAMFSAADCSVTQEAYCNVKTGEIELIKVYGNTFWHMPGRTGQNVELDMQIYIHDNAAPEGEMKADRFVEYIVSNSDAESASGAGSN